MILVFEAGNFPASFCLILYLNVMAEYDDSQSVLNSMQYLGSSINSAAANITTAQLDKKNREWYEEQYQIMREYNNHQREMAQEYNTMERLSAQEWSESMWNMTFDKTNEYNTPANQMQRLQAAGINPNAAAAAIGGGPAAGQSVPVSSGASSPSASSGAPGLPPLYNPAEAQASMMNANANAAAQFAQADLSKSMARKTEEETAGLLIDNSYKPFEKEADLNHAYASIQLMVKQGVLTQEQAEQIEAVTPALVGKTYAEISDLLGSAAVKNEQILQIQNECALLEEQIETEKHRQKEMDAGAFEAYMAGEAHKKAIEVQGVQMSLYDAQKRLTQLQGNEQILRNDWRRHCHELGYDPEMSKGLDRLIDGSGSCIKLFEQYGNQLVDGVKQKASSVKAFAPSLVQKGKNLFQQGKQYVKDNNWSHTWD